MRLSWTLTRYLGVQFLSAVAIVLGGFLVLVFIIDVVAMLQRFDNKEGITFGVVLTMSLMKMPNLLEETIPFATLAGATWSFARLSRSSELVVARAAGVSAWQFLAPAVAIGFICGLFLITAYNPLAAFMIEREESLEAKYLRSKASLSDVSSTGGLWLRQMDERGPSIINAQKVSEQGTRLEGVTIYRFEGQDRFAGMVAAKAARLETGRWALEGGESRDIDTANRPVPIADYATTLTRSQIQDSFASPKTMSFWQLPRFIRLAEQAGFSAQRHRLHYFTMIAKPLLLCAMILLAAVFALRVQRGRGLGFLVVGAVLAGFLLYAASSFSNALGLAGVVPVTLAAWAPAATATLLGVAFLLHFEDG